MADLAELIRQGALQRGLDPRAVLAVAAQEGLGGGIGDQGTSFGPFQLHYGGAYPSSAPQGAAASQAWATSPAGINYALDAIAKHARGLSGRAAVDAIVRNFERPADPAGEAARAWAGYGGGGTMPSSAPAVLPQALPSALPSVKIPGLDQPGFGGLNPISLIGKSGDALADSLVSQSLRSSDRALARFPTFKPPVSPRHLSAVADAPPPSALVPASLGKGATLGVPVVGGTVGGEHGTSGLEGYTGKDYFAPAGSKAVAPVSGKVIRLSGHDPKLGAIEGAGGPLGWSLYIQGVDGRTYYLTHMGSRTVHEGDTVKAGQSIGTVADYDRYGRPSHIHMGYTTT